MFNSTYPPCYGLGFAATSTAGAANIGRASFSDVLPGAPDHALLGCAAVPRELVPWNLEA
jgi:hypothetical protein